VRLVPSIQAGKARPWLSWSLTIHELLEVLPDALFNLRAHAGEHFVHNFAEDGLRNAHFACYPAHEFLQTIGSAIIRGGSGFLGACTGVVNKFAKHKAPYFS
jgi:hypothetical protein